MNDESNFYEQLVDALKRPDGPAKEDKKRPVHTIGIGASGSFVASDVASQFCKAGHFQRTSAKDPVPVTIRFSNGSGSATQRDGWSDLRGMAIRFHLGKDGKGQEVAADMLTMNLPEFFAPTKEDTLAFSLAVRPKRYPRESPWKKFTQLLRLQVPRRNPYPGETISPIPGGTKYANEHEFAQLSVFQDFSIGVPFSFARQPYHAVHTFIVTGDDGTRRWVRFSWEPTIGVLNKKDSDPIEDDFLNGELGRRLQNGPAKFSLMMAIGEAGDDLNNCARAWSFHRRRVFMGTLSVEKIAEDQWLNNEHLSFNPCRVVEGIDLSDDPVLHVRRGTYEVSRLRRGAPLCPFSRS